MNQADSAVLPKTHTFATIRDEHYIALPNCVPQSAIYDFINGRPTIVRLPRRDHEMRIVKKRKLPNKPYISDTSVVVIVTKDLMKRFKELFSEFLKNELSKQALRSEAHPS